jgi:hypothetical protein
MSKTIHLFSHYEPHTTARYFLSAIQNSKLNIRYWTTPPEPSLINDDDVFFFIDPASDWPIGLEKINCLTIGYLIDVHQDLKLRIFQSNFFDIVYLAQKDYIHYFEKSGHRQVFWLPLACAPDLYSLINFSRTIDVSFIGNFGALGSIRNETLAMIKNYFPNHITCKFTPPSEMVNIYQKSKIVFNISVNGDLNMRFFEAIASGALLITDRIKNGLESLFKENVHYVGYSSPKEAIDKINYYLQNEEERIAIASAGLSIAFKMHTYDARWIKITSDLNLRPNKNALARTLSKKELSMIYMEIFSGLRKPMRAVQALLQYGLTLKGFLCVLYSCCRKINQLIPITPNSIIFRIRNNKRR